MTGLQVAFRYLVDNLRGMDNVRFVRVLDEGAMLVNVAHPTFDEDIMVYLLAGELSVGFIKKTLNANTERDMHTLYIVALDLITDDGTTALMSDALRLLLLAYDRKIYVYRTDKSGVAVFPVHIELDRRMSYGDPVNLAYLGGDYATFNNKYLLGVRKIAGFEPRHYQQAHTSTSTYREDPLKPFYELLGLSVAANVDEVKSAYRRKARQHHPDTDKSPGATERMQAINEAYAKILERLE
ncbi:MAG: DnaJ domain-containing protein [Anaerolineae bacterium]|nr:DnaJ domain-containing protein [Anaerolineae bacterium]